MGMPTQMTIDGLCCSCVAMDQDVSVAGPGVCLIVCSGLTGPFEVIDVLRFDEAGAAAVAQLTDKARMECWRKRCPEGRLMACMYLMPDSGYNPSDRKNLEDLLRARHMGRLCS